MKEQRDAVIRKEPLSDHKKPYVAPVLKPYTAPKLCKHQSYKDITLLFATPVVALS